MTVESGAQGRAHTRLVAENRQRFRRIYVDAPDEMSRQSRRSWAISQLTLEYPERYREIYAEEKERLLLASADGKRSINPSLVGKCSGPGPLHAVLVDGSSTVCGRVRFHTYPVSAAGQATCSYCIDMLREKPARSVDPRFREQAAFAEEQLREFVDLQRRVTEARDAALKALGTPGRPPVGTAERAMYVGLLSKALESGLTLREVGEAMNVSHERIRQLTTGCRRQVASC